MSKRLIVERDVEAQMRDGITLRADVYRPDTDAQLPVLLQRTPYGKTMSSVGFALLAAERGYAVAIQDTRGRWNSDGDGYPFIYEKLDGYDSVAWVARAPWSNGKVGMFGASYVGYTQWAAASMQPPALKAIAPMVTFCDVFDAFHAGGAMALGVAASWLLSSYAALAVQRAEVTDAERMSLAAQVESAMDAMAQREFFKHTPLLDMPLIGRNGLTPFLQEYAEHPTHDDFWSRQTCTYESIQVPALHIGGWYDIFAKNTLADSQQIQKVADGDLAKSNQKVIVGPWLHGPLESLVGEVDFGMRASSAMVLPDEVQLRWFDYWLKAIDNGITREPPVRLFVMGENTWRDEHEWPLERTQYTPWYLHSSGAANTRHGDGALSTHLPQDEAVDSFVYDPRNPVPTRGGALCCSASALPAGAYDQRQVEERPDVLVYTSTPLDQPVEVTGPIKVHLWAVTNAPDTDFTAKLVDVGPCGYARNLVDGIVRARYRHGDGQAQFASPGEVVEYEIDLAVTSNLFKAGHRIRVDISSSNFPRFDRNANTGRAPGMDAEMRTALQTILHDAAHPSHIMLPVIPR